MTTERRPALFAANAADVDMLAWGFTKLNLLAASHVASHCPVVRGADGTTWHDTRPMLDPRECTGASIDLATEYLSYLEWSGALLRHPQQRYLVHLRALVAPAGSAQRAA